MKYLRIKIIHMNREKGEAGQTSILVLIILFIAGVVLLQQNIPVNKASVKEKCKIDPVDASQSITFKTDTYDLLRDTSALSTEQFKWHIDDNVGTADYGGKTYKEYKAKTLAASRAQNPTEWGANSAGPNEDKITASVSF